MARILCRPCRHVPDYGDTIGEASCKAQDAAIDEIDYSFRAGTAVLRAGAWPQEILPR